MENSFIVHPPLKMAGNLRGGGALIGYVEQNIEDALSLLDTVSVKLRDRQWYAVKIQLLQKKRHEQECVQRMLLAREIQKEVTALQHEYEQKFGAYSTNEFILSPDT